MKKAQISVFSFIFARGHQSTPAAFGTSISVARRSPHTLPIDSVAFVSLPRPASARFTGRRLCSAWLEATGPASCPSTSSWPCGESKTTSPTNLDGSAFLERQTAAGGRGRGSALSGASLKTTVLPLFERSVVLPS